MTARYRVTETKGAYMAQDPTPVLLQLGADHAAAQVYNIRSPVFELLKMGTELDFAGVPGPHLEPLNDEARDALAKYWREHPNATLDPTRRMPLGQDPMGGRSIEQLVAGLLERMDTEPAPSGAGQPSGDLVALLAGQKAMQDAMLALTAALTAALAPPAREGRAR